MLNEELSNLYELVKLLNDDVVTNADVSTLILLIL